MRTNNTCLLIVDMQRYYVDETSDFYRYFERMVPGCMSYIATRCRETVIPNISRLLSFYRRFRLTIIFLRLCGIDPDRKDLHRFFRESWARGKQLGYSSVYPLADEPMAQILPEIAPQKGELVIDKTTFSAFTSTKLESILQRKKITTLVFAGLATSQCVETTARDASDRGFEVIHIEDAQADYTHEAHCASLYSSQAVCGGNVFRTESFLSMCANHVILRE
ncbi:MAG: cysteine hydrolase [Spirochaetes bacterium]|nr:cysteine hydrolase [Spirochaetota bacterium]